MPSTEELYHMYAAAKAVFHEQLARDYAQLISVDFVRANALREQSPLVYFQGRYVSDLIGGKKTLRILTVSDVSPSSTEFQQTLWKTLVELVGPSRFLATTGVPPDTINPLQVVKRNEFVDVRFDILAVVSLCTVTAS